MDFDGCLEQVGAAVLRDGPAALGGYDLGRLARGLIAREVRPGGPYRDGRGVPTRTFNRTVARLLRSLGSPLPAVEEFIGTAPPIGRRTVRRPAALTSVQRDAEVIIKNLKGELRPSATKAYRRIVTADRGEEISAISRYFARSLPGHPAASPNLEAGLGIANLMAWTAYSVYDDFIDGEGDPQLLPVANVTHREALARYTEAVPAALRAECRHVFDGMDAANAWELAHCRFAVSGGRIAIGRLPRYGAHRVLAARARAHVLGPLIVARLAGTVDVAAVERALDHYLIARQLNDDLHDWAKDFARGHISPVVARLLAAVGVPEGRHDADRLLRRMKTEFWRSELTLSSRYALGHVRKARRLLQGPGVNMAAGSPFIVRVIAPIEDGLVRGLARHDADKKFLAAYRSPASTLAR